MAIPDPCCGSSLQQGAKFIAMLSMVLSVLGIFVTSAILFSFLMASNKGSLDESEENSTTIGIKIFVALISFVFNLFLAILLFIGSEQKNLRICIVWIKVTLFLFVLEVVWSAYGFFMDHNRIEDNILNACGILYSIYELWVVFAFTSEMTRNKEAVSACHTVSTTMTV